MIEITCGGQFHRLQTSFGRSSTDNKDQMVRRTTSCPQSFHLFGEKLLQTWWIQERFGLLVERSFVRGPAALCNEQKLVLRAFGRHEIDLCRQVRTRINLVEHVQRCCLGVTQVFFRVGLVNALREIFFIFHPCPNLLTLFANNCSRTGILTKWKNSL